MPSGSDPAPFYTDLRERRARAWSFDGQRCPDCDRVLVPVDGVRAACAVCGQVFFAEDRATVALQKALGARLALRWHDGG